MDRLQLYKVSPAAVFLLIYINHGAISHEISAMTLRTERWLEGHFQDDDLNDRPIIGMLGLELQTIHRFQSITAKAPTRACSWLKAPTSTFTFKNLLRHYSWRQ